MATGPEIGKGVFVDTSAWYALINARDEFNARASETLGALRLEESILHTSGGVIHETVALLRARHGRAAVLSFGAVVFGNPFVRIHGVEGETLREAFGGYESKGNGVSLVDHECFALMRLLGVRRSFTFDGDFRDAGFEVIP